MAADTLEVRPASRMPPTIITPRRRTLLPPGWPLAAVLCLYGVWWVIGFPNQCFIVFSIPMAVHLYRSRPIRFPPGFAIWALLLVWTVAGLALLGVNPVGTVPGVLSHRLFSSLLGVLQYAAATITMLYVGNLPPGVSQRRVLSWLGVFCMTVIAGGLLGMADPHLKLTSPFVHLLPSHLRGTAFVRQQFEQTAAQLQKVPGLPSGRPAAPFPFTNTWGNCLSVLLIWYVVAAKSGTHRLRAAIVLVIALVPIMYSLNRGMWIAMVAVLAYVGLRAVAHGHSRLLGAMFAGAVALIALVFLTPLHSTFTNRLHNGTSNDIRQYTSVKAFDYAERSPLVGYGGNRTLQGGEESITIGRSPDCPRCGNPILGENGEIWSVMVSNGFIGAGLYLGFFIYGIVYFWRDRTPIGIGGVAVLLLAVGYSFIYNSAGTALCLYLISYAMLWTNQRRRDNRPPPGRILAAPPG